MLNIKTFVFNPVFENTYVVYDDSKKAMIIDPGFFTKQEEEEFFNFLDNEKIIPVQLILTHAHFDHVFGLKKVVEKTNLTPILHPLEKNIYLYASTSAQVYELSFDPYVGKMAYMEEGEGIALGSDYFFKIIHTPGHSPGSISLHEKTEKIVFSGDVLFENSVGRTDIPMANVDDLVTSIKDKLYLLPKETKVYSGHGSPTTIGHEMTYNPFVKKFS